MLGNVVDSSLNRKIYFILILYNGIPRLVKDSAGLVCSVASWLAK